MCVWGGWWWTEERVEWADTRASRPRTNLPVTDTARQRAKRPVKAMVATALSLYVAECIVPLARLASEAYPLATVCWFEGARSGERARARSFPESFSQGNFGEAHFLENYFGGAFSAPPPTFFPTVESRNPFLSERGEEGPKQASRSRRHKVRASERGLEQASKDGK